MITDTSVKDVCDLGEDLDGVRKTLPAGHNECVSSLSWLVLGV